MKAVCRYQAQFDEEKKKHEEQKEGVLKEVLDQEVAAKNKASEELEKAKADVEKLAEASKLEAEGDAQKALVDAGANPSC